MPLSRDVKKTIETRLRRDSEFRKALSEEIAASNLDGESRVVRFTAKELRAKCVTGEDQTDREMSQEEAIRRRKADPEAPQPDDGWEDTIFTGLPKT